MKSIEILLSVFRIILLLEHLKFWNHTSIVIRLEDFSNQLNLRRVKRRVVALFLAKMTPPIPTSAHFEAPTAMLPALPSL